MEWPILAGIPEEDVRRVLQIARRRTFGRREVVFHRGDPADTLHLVHSGRFAVRIGTPLGRHGDAEDASARARRSARSRCSTTSAPRSATIVALETSETRAIHKLDFDALRARHPACRDILATALALRVRRLSELLVEAHYEPADRRVLRRVAELAVEGGVVPLTQEELSNLAGTSRATVNRVVRDAQERGEVELRRRRIDVLDGARRWRRA